MRLSKRVIGMGSRVWITREGVAMQWSEMTVSHLQNAARFLREAGRAKIGTMWQHAAGLQGEMALDAMDSAISHAENQQQAIELYADEMEEYANYRSAHVDQLRMVFDRHA